MNTQPIYITVKIPVRPHVKKYISSRYGTEHTLSKRSLLGMLIFQLLDKSIERPDHQREKLSEHYCIQIPEFYTKSKGFSIGYKRAHYLGVCLERLFMEDLVQSVEILHYKGFSVAESIRTFLKQFDINENDLNYDSIYRQFQREKKYREKAS